MELDKSDRKTENCKSPSPSCKYEDSIEKPIYLGHKIEAAIMGITIVIGGQLYGYNVAFTVGFGSYFSAIVLVGFSYIILMFALAELSSAITFSGGTYGLARVVLGFYSGFMIGSLELLEYTLMSTASVVYTGEIIVQLLGCDPNYQPLMWFIFYILVILTTTINTRVLWITSNIIGVTCTILLLIYCFGSLPYTNLSRYGPYIDSDNNGFNDYSNSTNQIVPKNSENSIDYLNAFWFIGGLGGWVNTLGYATWGYAGVESLTLMSNLVGNPKTDIPFGLVYGILGLFISNMFVTIVCCSLPPGLYVTSNLENFMTTGYRLIFPSLSDDGGLALILAGQIGMGWGFMTPIGMLLRSMSDSNLLPSILMLKDTTDKKSYKSSMVIGCLLSYTVCLLGFFIPSFKAAVQNIAIACGVLVYLTNFLAYYKFSITYSMVERNFKSPFGTLGAVFACSMFILVLISVLFSQNDSAMIELKSMVVVLVILTLYYFYFVKNTQKFSKDEDKTFFKFHLIKTNTRKAKAMSNPGRKSRNFSNILVRAHSSFRIKKIAINI